MATVQVEYQRPHEDVRMLELSMEGESVNLTVDAAHAAAPNDAIIERVEVIGHS